MRLWPLLALVMLLAACDEPEVAARPAPAELSADATGYFCMMAIDEHPGPKAQVFVEGREAPIWFPSVRDMLTFRLLPGETADVVAIYVSDTGAGDVDALPAPDAWVEAEAAFYVIGSDSTGGMGEAEAVPFAGEADARAFAAAHGGEVRRMDEIDAAWVFGEEAPAAGGES